MAWAPVHRTDVAPAPALKALVLYVTRLREARSRGALALVFVLFGLLVLRLRQRFKRLENREMRRRALERFKAARASMSAVTRRFLTERYTQLRALTQQQLEKQLEGILDIAAARVRALIKDDAMPVRAAAPPGLCASRPRSSLSETPRPVVRLHPG